MIGLPLCRTPESCEDSLSLPDPSGLSTALSPHDSLELGNGGFKLVIDDNVIVAQILLDFVHCHCESGRLISLSPQIGSIAAPETPLQSLQRRRQHEDGDGGVERLTDGSGPLNIDDQDRVVPCGLDAINLRPWRAVLVTVHLGPLEERSRLSTPVELLRVEKVILAPILLVRARRTGSGGNGSL